MLNRLFGLLAIAIFFSSKCLSQQTNDTTINQSEIIGVWQVKSNTISSTLFANFQFFKTGKFIYNVNGYDDLNPVYNVSGSFKVEKTILYLKIEQFKQLIGFKIVESNPGFQFGSFVLDGGKLVTVKQSNSSFTEYDLEVGKDLKSHSKYILIDNEKYFKLTSDPSKFNK
jgi:hypothetical protein